jgi:hypothetical protein
MLVLALDEQEEDVEGAAPTTTREGHEEMEEV